jgi:hypothetical protein
MLYYGIMNLGINEFGPVNLPEYAYLIVTLVISAIMNSIIFGDIAILISNLNQKSSQQQQSLDSANNVMSAIEVQNYYQEEIREYLSKTVTNKEDQELVDTLLSMIAPSFVVQVQNEMFKNILRRNKAIWSCLIRINT